MASWYELYFGVNVDTAVEDPIYPLVYMYSLICKSLLVDGVIGGVGGILTFLPIIFMLFFLWSLIEDIEKK